MCKGIVGGAEGGSVQEGEGERRGNRMYKRRLRLCQLSPMGSAPSALPQLSYLAWFCARLSLKTCTVKVSGLVPSSTALQCTQQQRGSSSRDGGAGGKEEGMGQEAAH